MWILECQVFCEMLYHYLDMSSDFGHFIRISTFYKIFEISFFLGFFLGFEGWNLKKLPSDMKKYITEKKPGITSPFLYVGGHASHFNIHIEEDGLGSINLLHNVSKVSITCMKYFNNS